MQLRGGNPFASGQAHHGHDRIYGRSMPAKRSRHAIPKRSRAGQTRGAGAAADGGQARNMACPRLLDPAFAVSIGDRQQPVASNRRLADKGGEICTIDCHHDNPVEFVVGAIQPACKHDELPVRHESGMRQGHPQCGGIVVFVLKKKFASLLTESGKPPMCRR